MDEKTLKKYAKTIYISSETYDMVRSAIYEIEKKQQRRCTFSEATEKGLLLWVKSKIKANKG
jgi:hypothetical protein